MCIVKFLLPAWDWFPIVINFLNLLLPAWDSALKVSTSQRTSSGAGDDNDEGVITVRRKRTTFLRLSSLFSNVFLALSCYLRAADSARTVQKFPPKWDLLNLLFPFVAERSGRKWRTWVAALLRYLTSRLFSFPRRTCFSFPSLPNLWQHFSWQIKFLIKSRVKAHHLPVSLSVCLSLSASPFSLLIFSVCKENSDVFFVTLRLCFGVFCVLAVFVV